MNGIGKWTVARIPDIHLWNRSEAQRQKKTANVYLLAQVFYHLSHHCCCYSIKVYTYFWFGRNNLSFPSEICIYRILMSSISATTIQSTRFDSVWTRMRTVFVSTTQNARHRRIKWNQSFFALRSIRAQQICSYIKLAISFYICTLNGN